MKRFKQHWAAAPLSWLLSASLALPAVLGLLALPQTARAQATNRQPTWAVVTFANTSGYGGAEEGVQASDGFVVELGKSNRYDVVPRSQTRQGIADIGLTEPLDLVGQQKLARSLDADAVASGEIVSVSFSSNPRRATVGLVIRVVDRTSGELVNGAVVTGASTPRPIPTNDDDALVNQAIESADFNAVRQISAFNLPRATVLIHRDADTVTLNKGTQDGLYDGLKMLVTRNGSVVGRLVVSDASPDEAEATVTDRGLGIQPQDVATAIYELPTYTTGPAGFHVGASVNTAPPASDNVPRGRSRPFFTGILGAALGIAAAVAIAGAAHNGSSTNSIGGGISGGVSAQLTANGPSQLFNVPDGPYFNNPLFVPLSIQINFDNGDISGNRLIENHVYRNPPPAILQNSTNFGPVPTLVTGELQPIPLFSPASSPEYDNVQDVTPIFVRKPDPTNNTAVIGPGDFAGGTAALQLPIPGTGLSVGDRVSYSIEALYTVPNLTAGQTGVSGGPVGVGGGPGGGGGTTSTGTGTTGTGTGTGTTATSGSNGSFIYTLSDKSKATTNSVTYLQPALTRVNVPPNGYPDAAAATDADNDIFGPSVAPNNVTVILHEVYANPGDGSGSGIPLQYALEFSTDLNFSGGNNTQRFTQANVPIGGTPTAFRQGPTFQFTGIDLTKQFPNPGTLYFRVGVRDQRNGGDEGSNPYLWSTTDPFNARVVPVALTPGTPNGTALRQAALAGKNGVTALAPVKAGHVRGVPSGAISPSAVPAFTDGVRPLFVPSQPLHPALGGASGASAPPSHSTGTRPGVGR